MARSGYEIVSMMLQPMHEWIKPADPGPDRERVRHGSPPNAAEQGRLVAQDGQTDGLQACHGCIEKVAAAKDENQLPKIIAGIKFTDGIETDATTDQDAA